MKKPLLLVLLGTAILLSSCQGAKYHYKKGNEFTDARLLKRAVTEYKIALDKRPDKVKYIQAMTTAGNMLMEELYSEYRFLDGKDSLSVYAFLEAKKWEGYLSPYVELVDKSAFYQADFDAQLSRHLERSYQRSTALIRERAYDRAQRRLQEINTLKPGYKDVADLLAFSEVEPQYNRALELFEQGDYRGVHSLLYPVLLKYPNQHEVEVLIDRALDRGKFRIGIVAGRNESGATGTFLAALRSATITALQNQKDPFIELLDRTDFDLLTREQRAIIDGQTSEMALTEELLVADAYLKIELTNYVEQEGDLERIERKGWEKYFIKSKNDEGETITKEAFRKVRYMEYRQQNRVQYAATMTLIDRATSRILATEPISFSREDEMHYIEFNGTGALYPGNWRFIDRNDPADRRDLREQDRRELDRLRKANRSIRSSADMRKEGLSVMSSRWADYVKQQNFSN